MAVVAVAGGTNGLGRAVVDQLRLTSKHKILVFSRKAAQGTREEDNEYTTVAVDYNSIDGIRNVLQDHGVDVVISTMNYMMDPTPEINLMRAIEQSRTTKRYIPSIFGSFHYEERHGILPSVKAKLDVLRALKETTVEYMAVYNGYFSDFLGVPRLHTYTQTIPVVIDMEANAAAIPGSGETPVAFTHTNDIAKFVVASLDLPHWPREGWIVGDKVTWNEVLEMAESVKGTKFRVVHDSIEMLQSGAMTELPGHAPNYRIFPKESFQFLFSQFGLWFHQGYFNPGSRQLLNQEFPNIQALKVRDVLEKGWGDLRA
ncbi:hypothetical protein G7054_g1609 [Neopestalotiopsis clavispora]|nr:hypothetical protein G7054_g1609 [Neopestalotiopsis clavispora]